MALARHQSEAERQALRDHLEGGLLLAESTFEYYQRRTRQVWYVNLIEYIWVVWLLSFSVYWAIQGIWVSVGIQLICLLIPLHFIFSRNRRRKKAAEHPDPHQIEIERQIAYFTMALAVLDEGGWPVRAMLGPPDNWTPDEGMDY